MKHNRRRKFRFVALCVIALPVAIVLFYSLTKLLTGLTPDDVFAFAGGDPVIEVMVVLLLYAVKSVLFFIPVMFLYMLTGNLFPPFYSVLINILGLAITVSLTFFLGKRLGKKFVEKLIRKSPKIQDFMENQNKSNVTLFALRASNIFPVELLSLACGCTGYRYLSFLGLTLLAMAPGLVLFTLMGDSLKNPLSAEFLIPFGVFLVMTASSLIVYKLKQKDE